MELKLEKFCRRRREVSEMPAALFLTMSTQGAYLKSEWLEVSGCSTIGGQVSGGVEHGRDCYPVDDESHLHQGGASPHSDML